MEKQITIAANFECPIEDLIKKEYLVKKSGEDFYYLIKVMPQTSNLPSEAVATHSDK